MSKIKLPIRQQGSGLVEILIAAFIIAVAFTALLSAYSLSLKTALRNTSKIQAALLLEEGQEAVRSIRDAGWASNIATLTAGTPYYLAFNTGTNKWNVTGTNNYVDNLFERQVVVNDVYRDGSNNIIPSGGTLDPKTKKLTTTVAWRDGNATTSQNVSTYLINLLNN